RAHCRSSPWGSKHLAELHRGTPYKSGGGSNHRPSSRMGSWGAAHLIRSRRWRLPRAGQTAGTSRSNSRRPHLTDFRLERATRWRDTARAMSEENVEIVRGAFQYLASGLGGSEVLASFDPGVVMKPVETGATYGLNAFRDNFERWKSTFGEIDVTVEEIIDA